MLTINDDAFSRPISLRDAYRLLFAFLEQYHNHGESPTGTLLGDMQLRADGGSADPAQLQDFLRVADSVRES